MERVFVLLLMLFCHGFCLGQEIRRDNARKTENLIIITLDGYRWRELFNGADKAILFRNKYTPEKSVQTKFWHNEKENRRAALMPFIWNVVAHEGQLYGNRKHGNKMRCTNFNLYSYSGYSEMFVGFVDRRIKDNSPIDNPNYTVLETLNNHADYKNSVAIFSSWDVIPHIFRESVSGLYVNSAADNPAAVNRTSDHEHSARKRRDDPAHAIGERFDRLTFGYAFEYLKRERPRVLYISFDETDEHAHDKRYDRYLMSAHRSDSLIGELWDWIQQDPQYRDKTTLMITTDHGRGTSPRGWRRHTLLFRGSAQIWLAVIGPDTPATGEMTNRSKLFQKQIARTISGFLQVPYTNVRDVGDAIPTVIRDPQKIPDDEVLRAEAD